VIHGKAALLQEATMERIKGPINGVYVASYACKVGELGLEYVGYTKLCTAQPSSFWDADGEVTFSERRFATERDAMDNAEALAMDRLRH